jgi:8-oxo-dGTP pyrophosphatase MutT (NUDIX family)
MSCNPIGHTLPQTQRPLKLQKLSPPKALEQSTPPALSMLDLTQNQWKAWSSYKPLHQKVCGCICISPLNKILLVKGRKGQIWSFPKGHYEKTDKTSLACALRELKEETGIRLNQDYISFKKYKAAEYYIFEVPEEYRLFPKDTQEIDDARWFTYEEVCSLHKNIDVSLFCQTIEKKILPDLVQENVLEDPLVV